MRSRRARTCASWQAIVASGGVCDDLTLPACAGIGEERLPQVSWHRVQSGRCASLDVSLDITGNGREHRAVARLARLLEGPTHVA